MFCHDYKELFLKLIPFVLICIIAVYHFASRQYYKALDKNHISPSYLILVSTYFLFIGISCTLIFINVRPVDIELTVYNLVVGCFITLLLCVSIDLLIRFIINGSFFFKDHPFFKNYLKQIIWSICFVVLVSSALFTISDRIQSLFTTEDKIFVVNFEILFFCVFFIIIGLYHLWFWAYNITKNSSYAFVHPLLLLSCSLILATVGIYVFAQLREVHICWSFVIICAWLPADFILRYFINHFSFLRLHIKRIGQGVIIASLVAVLSIVIANNNKYSYLATEGAVFAVIVGVLTLVSLILAIYHLHNVHTRISTYEEYLDRAADMIKKLSENAEKELTDKTSFQKKKIRRSKFTVKMVCFTPKHGNMSAINTAAYRDFDRVLMDAIDKSSCRFEIVCLDFESGCEPFKATFNNDYKSGIKDLVEYPLDKTKYKESENPCALEELYYGFGRASTEEECIQGFLDSCKVILLIQNKIQRSVCDHVITPRSRDRLPTFHFILSRKRAIVVAPLFLPESSRIAIYKLKNNVNKRNRSKDHNVDMIGFETNEPHVLAELDKAYNFWAGPPEKTILIEKDNGTKISLIETESQSDEK